MRTTPLLAALLIAGTAVAASVPELPTCQDPALEALCIHIVIGDIVVGSGDTEEWSDGTYVAHGTVTVRAGGTFRIIDAQVAAGGQAVLVQVDAGGVLVIVDSDITGAPGGAPPQIVANATADVTVSASTFVGMTLVLRTNDATLDGNSHASSDPALRLEHVSLVVEQETFAGNTVAVNVTGGAPTLRDLSFSADTTAMEFFQTSADVVRGTMSDVTFGIVATESQGEYTGMALDDRTIPPSIGIDMTRNSGPTVVSDNTISEFGTGIRCTDTGGHVTLSDNSFSNNGQNVAGDC